MHVGIFADMEGSIGIWDKKQCHRVTPAWQYGRECLTADINRVIKGAFDGGATKVTVKDTHDTGFNCIRKKLDPRVDYNGGPYVRPTIFGKIPRYDLILYVAIHAASGTQNAFFPHTHFSKFSELKLNGKPICEMELYGGSFGEMGIPVGFVSGEDIAVQQAISAMPWLKTVSVDKKKEKYSSGESSIIYISACRQLLQDKSEEAVRQAHTMKPLVYSRPFHFEAIFKTDKIAKHYNSWGLQRDGNIVSWDSETVMEGFDTINKLTWFPKRIYPFLPILLVMFRLYFQVKHNI